MQEKAGPNLVHQLQLDAALQRLPWRLARVDLLRRFIPAIEMEIRELPVGAPLQATSSARRVYSIANRGGRCCRAGEGVTTTDLLERRNSRRGGHGSRIVSSLMRHQRKLQLVAAPVIQNAKHVRSASQGGA